MDRIGGARRAAYADALAARDRRRLASLTAAGIPTRWTATEIEALERASLSLEEKRRRIALLFANPDRLAAVFDESHRALLPSLRSWLPDSDWAPILRLIAAHPAAWMRRMGYQSPGFGSPALRCRIDHAFGFLCGGGLDPDVASD